MLPNEFMKMTLKEIYEAYEFRMKRIKFDEESNNRRTARILCMIANINRDTKKKKTPFTEDDFMPTKVEPKKPQTPDEMASILEAVTRANKGTIE